jgi:hypothetical protein
MTKTYLGDEIHELVAELTVTKQELELIKMLSERKDAENIMLRQQLAELKAEMEEKTSDSSMLYMLLEQQAQSLSMGIQRFRRAKDARLEKRDTREMRRQESQPVRPAPAQSNEDLREPLPEEQTPLFLRRTGTVTDHPLLPELGSADEGSIR